MMHEKYTVAECRNCLTCEGLGEHGGSQGAIVAAFAKASLLRPPRRVRRLTYES